MKGHGQVLALRRRGRMPPSVTLWVSGRDAEGYDWTPYGARAQVEIDPVDRPERLDLRFLVSVPLVWVRGDDADRVRRVTAAAIAAKPVRVVSVVYGADHRVSAMTDTAEVLTWPN